MTGLAWALTGTLGGLVFILGGLAAALYGRAKRVDEVSDALTKATGKLGELGKEMLSIEAKLGLSELARHAAEKNVVDLTQILDTERARFKRSQDQLSAELANLQAAAAKAATGPELLKMVDELLTPRGAP